MIKKIATYIIGTAAVFSAVWGMFRAFDTVQDNQEDMIESIEHINVEQQFQAEDLAEIKDTLWKLEAEHKAQGANIESLGWAIKNLDNFTPEQMEEILDRTLRNNPTAYRGSVEIIPID